MWCSKKRMLAVGDQAPAVQLKTPDGKVWNLHEALRDSRVLLVFFKASCPTCQFTLPFLERLAGHSAHSIMLVSQEDAVGTRQFLQHFGVSLPAVVDEPRSYPASNAFHITNVPSLFMIEQDGRISAAITGFQKAEMENLGLQFGMPMFRPGEQVPQMRPG